MQKKKILIVDDDPMIIEATRLILELEGYSVVSAYEGNSVKKMSFDEVGLVLLDIWLGNSDGGAICKEIKEKNTAKPLPVILISAHPHAATIADESNADGYLHKPFDIEELLSLVKQYAM